MGGRRGGGGCDDSWCPGIGSGSAARTTAARTTARPSTIRQGKTSKARHGTTRQDTTRHDKARQLERRRADGLHTVQVGVCLCLCLSMCLSVDVSIPRLSSLSPSLASHTVCGHSCIRRLTWVLCMVVMVFSSVVLGVPPHRCAAEAGQSAVASNATHAHAPRHTHTQRYRGAQRDTQREAQRETHRRTGTSRAVPFVAAVGVGTWPAYRRGSGSSSGRRGGSGIMSDVPDANARGSGSGSAREDESLCVCAPGPDRRKEEKRRRIECRKKKKKKNNHGYPLHPR